MRVFRLSALVATLCLVGWQVQRVQAAPIPWGNPNGTAPGGGFSWANGSNDTNLFGDPIPLANGLLFNPSNFKASSSGGVPSTASDKINVDITAGAGQQILQINILEAGDFGIPVAGPNTSVNVFGTLVTTPLPPSPPGLPLVTPLVVTPGMPRTAVGNGTWQGIATAVVGPGGVTKVHLALDNVLQATSDANTTSFIEKKVTQAVIIQVILPEPGTIGMLLCGAPLLLRRRRSR